VWCEVCGVWCVVCGVWCVVCGVWCVVCGVWCVVCGVAWQWQVRTHRAHDGTVSLVIVVDAVVLQLKEARLRSRGHALHTHTNACVHTHD
jgi:hypothetical protein